MLLFKTFNLLELVAHLVEPVYKQRQHKAQVYEERDSCLDLNQRCDLLDLVAVDRVEFKEAVLSWIIRHDIAMRFPVSVDIDAALEVFDKCAEDLCGLAKFSEFHNRRDGLPYVGIMVQPNERLRGCYDAQLVIMNDGLVDFINRTPAKIDY